MKLYQPDYYDKFQCTASACPMTCCMQWRIAVDDETLFHWQEDWKKHVKEVEEGHIIRLNKDGMCPFHNEEKLCKIVLRVKCRVRVPFVTQESLFVNENLIL